MANEFRKEVKLVPKTITQMVDAIVMQDIESVQSQVVDGQVVDVPVITQVPVTVQQEQNVEVMVYEEVETQLTDAEQAALDAKRAALVQPQLATALAAHRTEFELAGVMVDGNIIPTDPHTKTLILMAVNATQFKMEYVLNTFKTKDGKWISLNSNQIFAIMEAMLAHSEKCLETEKALADKLDTYTSVDNLLIDFDAAMNS